MAYYLYRINGSGIQGMSVNVDGFGSFDDTYFDVVSDPPTPDGPGLDPLKIWDGSNVRNATVPEIANFTVAEAEDNNLIQRQSAKDYLNIHPTTRKALRSALEIALNEINILRAIHSLPDRTLTQFLNTVDNKIDSGDND
jgi:hypothetical protein